MSPHPRYNSRVLTFLSRQFGTLRDRTQELVRHTKMVSRWTAEVALYPFSRLVQTQKALGQKVQQTVQTLSKKLTSALDPPNALQASDDSSAPIQRTLEAIELVQQPNLVKSEASENSTPIVVTIHAQKRLPTLITVGAKALRQIKQFFLPPSSPQTLDTALELELAAPQSLAIDRPQHGRLAWVHKGVSLFRRIGNFLQPSASAQALKSPSGLTHSNQLIRSENSTIRIQGVASLLASRTLVLVTPEQDILDILSPEQQTHLYQRMMQELSRFYWRHRKTRIGKATQRLFEKSLNMLHLPPCLPILGGAETQNPPIYSPDGHSRKGDLGGKCNIDRTFQTASQLFDRLRLTRPMPSIKPLLEAASTLVPQPTLLCHKVQTRIDAVRTVRFLTPSAFTQASKTLSKWTPISQRVSSRNIIPKLPRFHWKHRKTWITNPVTQLFNRLSLAGSAPSIKPRRETSSTLVPQPIPLWRQTKKWIIHSVIGALVALPIVAIPAIATENNPRPHRPTPPQPVSALWVDPNHLKTPVALEKLYGLISGQIQGQPGLRSFPKSTESSHITRESVSPKKLNYRPGAENSSYHTEILIDAEFLGYEPHLLESILTGLDTLMVTLESSVAILWTWIGMLTILCLSGLQKLRQLIPD